MVLLVKGFEKFEKPRGGAEFTVRLPPSHADCTGRVLTVRPRSLLVSCLWNDPAAVKLKSFPTFTVPFIAFQFTRSSPTPFAVIIEDEAQIRRFVSGALESEGWQVNKAENGKGLTEADRRKPDLLVLDRGLPDSEALDVIRYVRGWSAVPIIVLSAPSDESDKIAALDAGADDYLIKPFGVGELLARVRADLRRPRAAGGESSAADDADRLFRFGEVELDRQARIVRRAGAEVHLTPIEYRLQGNCVCCS